MCMTFYIVTSSTTGTPDAPLSYAQVKQGAEENGEERAFIFFN